MNLLKKPSFRSHVALSAMFSRRYWAVWALGLALIVFLLAPWSLYDKLWGIAFAICPQRPFHSLFLGGVQMPIEAREGGIFAGFALGVVYLFIKGRGKSGELPSARLLALLVGFIALMGLDGLNAVAYDFYLPTPYAPNLPMRLGTGLLAGLGVAGILWPVFNQTMWRLVPRAPSFGKLSEVGTAVFLLILFWLAGLSGWDFLLLSHLHNRHCRSSRLGHTLDDHSGGGPSPSGWASRNSDGFGPAFVIGAGVNGRHVRHDRRCTFNLFGPWAIAHFSLRRLIVCVYCALLLYPASWS